MNDTTIADERRLGPSTRLYAAFQSLVWSRHALWLLLSLPAWPMLFDLWWGELYYAETMYISGVYSAQFLVLTLAVTPLTMILRKWEWGRLVGRWLLPRRRYVGLAAAAYAFLHAAHYIRYERDFWQIIYEAMDVEYLAGWIAVLIFIPLALTSNAMSVRRLRSKWKPLQQCVYIAAVGAFLHWWLLDQRQNDVYIWLALLVLAKGLHVAQRWYQARTPKRSS